MNEPPARAIASVTHYVHDVAHDEAAEAVEEHIEHSHIPPPRRGRVTAIPFPNMRLDDSQVSRAWEMLQLGATSGEVCAALDVPELVLIRCLSEYQPAWRNFLAEREAGI